MKQLEASIQGNSTKLKLTLEDYSLALNEIEPRVSELAWLLALVCTLSRCPLEVSGCTAPLVVHPIARAIEAAQAPLWVASSGAPYQGNNARLNLPLNPEEALEGLFEEGLSGNDGADIDILLGEIYSSRISGCQLNRDSFLAAYSMQPEQVFLRALGPPSWSLELVSRMASVASFATNNLRDLGSLFHIKELFKHAY